MTKTPIFAFNIDAFMKNIHFDKDSVSPTFDSEIRTHNMCLAGELPYVDPHVKIVYVSTRKESERIDVVDFLEFNALGRFDSLFMSQSEDQILDEEFFESICKRIREEYGASPDFFYGFGDMYCKPANKNVVLIQINISKAA